MIMKFAFLIPGYYLPLSEPKPKKLERAGSEVFPEAKF